MKKTALILALAMIGVSAMAGLVVSWNTAWGFNNHVIGQGESETIWALVYSSSAIGTFAPTPSAENGTGITDGTTTFTYKGVGLTATGSEILAAVKSSGSSTFANDTVKTGATNIQDEKSSGEDMDGLLNTFNGKDLSGYESGYLYQVVFQLNEAKDEVSYFVSDSAAISADRFPLPPAPGKSMYLENAGNDASEDCIDFAGTYKLGETPVDVPEPATLSLLGLGALALAIRRRK